MGKAPKDAAGTAEGNTTTPRVEGSEQEPPLNYLCYQGVYPQVFIDDVGKFLRGQANGPFSAEIIEALTRKRNEKDKPEFVACVAPAPAQT